MELKELRSLAALADLKNLSSVAEHTHLSPPAVHKQLKILENELGVPLYEKFDKELQLTPEAGVLLPHIKEMFANLEFALSALDQWKGISRGSVRIGSGQSSYVLPWILKHFRQSHGEVEVIVETGNTPTLLENLRNGALDVAFVVSADLSERKEFMVEAIWNFDLVMVTNIKRLTARPHLADLASERFILFRQGSRMQEPIDRYFAIHNFEPTVVMRFDNPDFIRSMVHSGLGIAFLPLWVVRRDLKEKRLSLIRPVESTPSSRVALIRRNLKYLPRPVEEFIATASALKTRDLSRVRSTNSAAKKLPKSRPGRGRRPRRNGE